MLIKVDICIWCAKYNEYGENMVSSEGEIGTKKTDLQI